LGKIDARSVPFVEVRGKTDKLGTIQEVLKVLVVNEPTLREDDELRGAKTFEVRSEDLIEIGT
jgi:hypothetical protein